MNSNRNLLMILWRYGSVQFPLSLLRLAHVLLYYRFNLATMSLRIHLLVKISTRSCVFPRLDVELLWCARACIFVIKLICSVLSIHPGALFVKRLRYEWAIVGLLGLSGNVWSPFVDCVIL